MKKYFKQYVERLNEALKSYDWMPVEELAEAMKEAWERDRQIFVCGNGGSAANALHWANDFIYPVCKSGGRGMRITALPANTSILTCLGNDISYDEIFSHQLATLARAGDLLIVLSGSGNSPNIVRALQKAREIKMKTFAILGFDGGKCLKLADTALHLPVHDMQIAENFQMIICHAIMQALARNQ
ncbi:MAG: SIS domain-containing protein [Verrucomicrobiota bacterium]